MDYVDLIFGAILAFFVIIGFSKGLFREIFGLAGILGGVIAGIIFTGPLSDFFVNKAPAVPSVAIPIVCFTFIFILVFLLSRILANWLSSITRAIHLGWLNKLLGGIVGGLKGGLILSLLLLLISVFPLEPTIDSMRNKSYFSHSL
ncbi:MAG: CvpA family protein [Calditrichia bacterium]